MIHMYDTDIAKEFGVAEAVFISNFSFWIFKNKTNGVNFYDGHYWTYNSVRALCEQFPEYSKRQIERVLDNLVAAGVLIKGEYNSNRYDRTNWYAFSDENRFLPAGNSISPNGEINSTKRGNQFPQTVEPIPDINTNINTDNNPYTQTKVCEFPQGGTTDRCSVDWNFVLEKWNTIAEHRHLAKMRSLTPQRKKAFLQRLKQIGTEDPNVFFAEIDKALGESMFLLGKRITGFGENMCIENTDWRADFDFFLQARSFQRAIEGGYADPDLRK